MCKSSTAQDQMVQQQKVELTDFEKQLINCYQGGIPLDPEPFHIMAEQLQSTSDEVQQAIKKLLEQGVLTRFGPLYNIEKMGGAFSLCALKVPHERFDEIAEIVNSYTEVAHNYQRDHEWNMWFVLATETKQSLKAVFNEITEATGCPSINLPKQQEFFVGLKFQV